MPIIFIENMNFFGGKCSRLTFCDEIEMFVANKVLFMTTKEKPSALLTLVIAFVRRKYKIYLFYCVSISDKHFSIVNIKDGSSVRNGAIENDKIFWRENSPPPYFLHLRRHLSITINFLIFLIEFVFTMNTLTVIKS